MVPLYTLRSIGRNFFLHALRLTTPARNDMNGTVGFKAEAISILPFFY